MSLRLSLPCFRLFTRSRAVLPEQADAGPCGRVHGGGEVEDVRHRAPGAHGLEDLPAARIGKVTGPVSRGPLACSTLVFEEVLKIFEESEGKVCGSKCV